MNFEGSYGDSSMPSVLYERKAPGDCTTYANTNFGHSFTDSWTCCFGFTNPDPPTFVVPGPGGSQTQLNPSNPIVLSDGTALTSGCNGNTLYFENSTGSYTEKYTGSDGNTYNAIDIIFASGTSVYANTIQSWQGNLRNIMNGKNALLFANCNNGVKSCMRFVLSNGTATTTGTIISTLCSLFIIKGTTGTTGTTGKVTTGTTGIIYSL
jgi:hypothetical protein